MSKIIACRPALPPLATMLLAGVSLAMLTPAMARAATYEVADEAELHAAIAAANASPDASSTITLSSSFSIVGTTLPAIQKNLTIDTGGNSLEATGGEPWNIAAGATLTIEGSNDVASGMQLKSGDGTLVLNGVTGLQGTGIEVTAGTMRIEGGSDVTAAGATGTPPVKVSGGSLILSGADTKLSILADHETASIGGVAGAQMIIRDGATLDSATSFAVGGGGGGTTGTMLITGADTMVDIESLGVLAGTGYISVTDGAVVEAGSAGIGGLSTSSLSRGGTGYITVSGAGSRWDVTNNYRLYRGTLDIVDGGAVSAGLLSVGTTTTATASVTVSGADSELVIAGDIEMGLSTGTGSLTVARGGLVEAGGTIKLTTTGANGSATLNIGGAADEAATEAGTLAAGSISFGAGLGVLNFNHTDAAYALDTTIAGNAGKGTINQLGTGRTILGGSGSGFTGQTNVLAGILEVNGTLGSAMEVLGGRLQGTGTVGATRNATGGTIAPGVNGIGTLTIGGDYTSAGGALEIETVLGDDASDTDLLMITGDALLDGAPTLIRVTNVGGLGDSTDLGIKIIDVAGATSTAETFVLGRPAVGGVYVYELFQGVDDGDWYLRNTEVLAPTVPTLENYPVALLNTIDLPTLRQRVGDREAAAETVWTRIEGNFGHGEAASSTTGASYDSSLFLAQIGVETDLVTSGDGTLTGGLTAQYARHYAEVLSAYGDGSNLTEGLGLGASLTWRGSEGTYLDLQGQFAGFWSDLDAAGYRLVEDNGGSGFAVSLEVGHKLQLDDTWAITPQAQLRYATVDFESFTDSFGSDVSLEQGDSLVGRLGLAVDYEQGGTQVYAIGNLTYEFLDGAAVAVSGTDLSYSGQKFGAELGLGGNVELNDGGLALHGELLGRTSFEGSGGIKGTLGLTGKL